MKAVLLAAGIGKRLHPITDSCPKSMIKIAGKPILEYILEDLHDSGFNEICIVVGHEANQIKDYFDNWQKNKIKITFVNQDKFKGTAHATYCAKNFVGTDKFLLYLSDTLIPNTLKEKLSEMITDKSDVSILSSQVFSNDTASIGNIIVENDYVVQIEEKSKRPKSNLAWAGVAFFKNNFIFNIIENLKPSKLGEYDIPEALSLAINQNKKIKNFNCEQFIDCGTTKGLIEGLKFILTKKHESMESNNISYTIIDPSYIGKNCLIGKNVTIGPFVSIGNNISIGNNVKISKAIVSDNTIINSNMIISESIISGENTLSSNDNIL